MTSLPQQRPHFPRTTASPRQYLFQLWESTGDYEFACRKARVSRRTFYNWKKRFESGGYKALQEFASHAPQNPRQTPQEVQERVIQLRIKHPNWGKQRITDEITKANNWVPLVSPNTVRRILIDAGLWKQVKAETNQNKPTKARTAEKQNQTVNIDLCFVPVNHEPEVKLPAVSGSSGKLVVERQPSQVKEWPCRIFEDSSLTYEEAMQKFIEASQVEGEQNELPLSPEELEALDLKGKKRAIRHEEEALRAERRKVREKRKAEDAAWKAIREQRKQDPAPLKEEMAAQETNTKAESKDNPLSDFNATSACLKAAGKAAETSQTSDPIAGLASCLITNSTYDQVTSTTAQSNHTTEALDLPQVKLTSISKASDDQELSSKLFCASHTSTSQQATQAAEEVPANDISPTNTSQQAAQAAEEALVNDSRATDTSQQAAQATHTDSLPANNSRATDTSQQAAQAAEEVPANDSRAFIYGWPKCDQSNDC